MPGVLVLVEQHHPIAVPQFLTDLRKVTANRAADAICIPKSMTFAARMRSCSASSRGTSSVRSVWVASSRSSH
jgi:hypothetical protein